jgi:hypothetical protein
VTVVCFPIEVRERPTIGIRTKAALLAGQLFKPFVK